jgi:hypothetical protein
MSRRMPRLVPGLILGLAALLLALPVFAGQVYQWKDASGVTHFSDAPPPDKQNYQNRNLKDEPGQSEPTATKPPEDSNCVTARKNLENLKSDKPVGLDANGDGQPDREMSAEDRASQVAQTEQTLKSYCSGTTP